MSERHCSADAESVRRVLLEARQQGAYGVAPGTEPGTPWVALRNPREEAPVLCQKDGRFVLGRWKRSARPHAVVKSIESVRQTKGSSRGFRVAYLAGKERLYSPGEFSLDDAISGMRWLKARGRTAWVEDLKGQHVPVPGAMRPIERSRQAHGRRSFTYGELPSYTAFLQAFDEELGSRGLYLLSLRGRSESLLRRCGITRSRDVRTVNLTSGELWKFLECLARGWSRWSSRGEAEEAGDLASSILTTLGFEWI